MKERLTWAYLDQVCLQKYHSGCNIKHAQKRGEAGDKETHEKACIDQEKKERWPVQGTVVGTQGGGSHQFGQKMQCDSKGRQSGQGCFNCMGTKTFTETENTVRDAYFELKVMSLLLKMLSLRYQ